MELCIVLVRINLGSGSKKIFFSVDICLGIFIGSQQILRNHRKFCRNGSLITGRVMRLFISVF